MARIELGTIDDPEGTWKVDSNDNIVLELDDGTDGATFGQDGSLSIDDVDIGGSDFVVSTENATSPTFGNVAQRTFSTSQQSYQNNNEYHVGVIKFNKFFPASVNPLLNLSINVGDDLDVRVFWRGGNETLLEETGIGIGSHVFSQQVSPNNRNTEDQIRVEIRSPDGSNVTAREVYVTLGWSL